MGCGVGGGVLWGRGREPREEREESGVYAGFPVYERAIDVETEEFV